MPMRLDYNTNREKIFKLFDTSMMIDEETVITSNNIHYYVKFIYCTV